MLFIEGIEEYSVYESCLVLGMDVNEYAMEAIDFNKMKETVSKKFQEVKNWVSVKWSDIKAKFTEVIATIIGKVTKNESLSKSGLSKEEKEALNESRRGYEAMAKSEKAIKFAARKYVIYVHHVNDYNSDNEEKQKIGRAIVENEFRNAALHQNIYKELSREFKDLDKYADIDAHTNIQARRIGMEFIESAIKEGKRMVKLGDVLMKGPIQQLFAAVTGVMKAKDAKDNGAGKAFQAAIQGLNIIGMIVRFILKMVMIPLKPLTSIARIYSYTKGTDHAKESPVTDDETYLPYMVKSLKESNEEASNRRK